MMMDTLSWKDRTVDMPMDPTKWSLSAVSAPSDTVEDIVGARAVFSESTNEIFIVIDDQV